MEARMSEEFYESVLEFLPEEKEPGPQGGRRTTRHLTVLKVIWFVLVTGCRCRDVPLELGCCGDRTGPSPVDRRKRGTKYTLLVDRHGVPLVVQSASANTSDHRHILSTVAAFPAVGGKPSRPKELPATLYADAGHDSDPHSNPLSRRSSPSWY